jgi:N-formylglutamate amidohydrolase
MSDAAGPARRLQRCEELLLVPDDLSRSTAVDAGPAQSPSFIIAAPERQTAPLVFASPHSGDEYPQAFLAASGLSFASLRRSEDAFVDRLFATAPQAGAPLISARFPRAYLDPNREPYELDPAMFDGPLPDFVNRRSPRVQAGLGTVARVVATGEHIYACKLRFAEVSARIEQLYFPYHRALQALLAATQQQFGGCLLIDCHSMPSVGGPMDSDPGLRRVDFVLGDCFRTACTPSVTEFVAAELETLGYSVRRNIPYAGGYTTRHYGRPHERRHALQIEINRALYMDEVQIVPHAGFARLSRDLGRLIARLTEHASRLLALP